MTNVKEQNISEGVRESQFEVLTLEQYVVAMENNCRIYHQDCKQGCQQMVNAGKIVLKEKFVALSSLWRRAFLTVQYDCEKAQLKLLQMPVTSLRLTGGCVVVEKRADGLYENIKREIGTMPEWSKAPMNNSTDSIDVKKT